MVSWNWKSVCYQFARHGFWMVLHKDLCRHWFALAPFCKLELFSKALKIGLWVVCFVEKPLRNLKPRMSNTIFHKNSSENSNLQSSIGRWIVPRNVIVLHHFFLLVATSFLFSYPCLNHFVLQLFSTFGLIIQF